MARQLHLPWERAASCWWVDGHNVTHGVPELRAHSGSETWIQAWMALAARCRELARQRGVPVVLVFDGPEPDGGPLPGDGLRIVYSGKRTADEVIVAQVEAHTGPANVVTDDQGLRTRLPRRAWVVPVDEFWARTAGRPTSESACDEPVGTDPDIWDHFLSLEEDPEQGDKEEEEEEGESES